MQLRRYCQIGTLYHLLEMSALRSHTRAKTSTPLFDCVVDRSRAGPGVPIPQRCAVATRPHFGFSSCTPAAEEGPISCNGPG